MKLIRERRIVGLLPALALLGALVLAACGSDNSLYVPKLLEQAQTLNGKTVTVDGAYLGLPGNPSTSVLALGVSTLDNGLDAKPLGEPIWLDGFPQETANNLHQPGDSVYGFVRVNGLFESAGGYGPNQEYKYRIQVASATPIESVQRKEERVTDASLGEGKVTLFELVNDPAKYAEQTVTTQGYYFWNGPLAVLAEGVSTEKDGSSPQPIGKMIWMDGFPADKSGELNLGQNNSYVWGKVEVTGQLKSGGGFGKDGAYNQLLQVTSAQSLETVKK
ncbi:MAG TPA: hypothetical protein VFX76_17710 [Roseiflexaceae bacterium]|nr:hypothetical protein [Roseiflexaceae bacterium]